MLTVCVAPRWLERYSPWRSVAGTAGQLTTSQIDFVHRAKEPEETGSINRPKEQNQQEFLLERCALLSLQVSATTEKPCLRETDLNKPHNELWAQFMTSCTDLPLTIKIMFNGWEVVTWQSFHVVSTRVFIVGTSCAVALANIKVTEDHTAKNKITQWFVT